VNEKRIVVDDIIKLSFVRPTEKCDIEENHVFEVSNERYSDISPGISGSKPEWSQCIINYYHSSRLSRSAQSRIFFAEHYPQLCNIQTHDDFDIFEMLV
jgi:hypothetical protein